jgi:hypothetical protein
MAGRIGRLLVMVGALPLLLVGTGPVGASARQLGGVPLLSKVYVIMGENTELGQINESNAPYTLGTLKPNSAWLTNYFALTHFSEANYVGMTSGQFTACQQFDGSAASCHQDVDNVFHQLDVSATGSWQSWMESMPEPCYLTSTGSAKDLNHYGAKHNPAIFYDDIEGEGGVWSPTNKSAECLANDIPAGSTGPNDMSAFDAAVQAGTTAQFNFVVPNECEDAHDNCMPQGNPVSQFDDFLSREVPVIQTYDPDALIIVTFDEGTSNRGDGHGHQFKGGGNVAWFALGPQVVPGAYSSASYDHYSFLRTLEDGFELPCLQAACVADPITGIWA